MEPNVAKIYYMPPMSNRLNQIRWAQQLLESRGFKVKEIESRSMSSGDRRALEQGGHAYPVVYAHGRFIVRFIIYHLVTLKPENGNGHKIFLKLHFIPDRASWLTHYISIARVLIN